MAREALETDARPPWPTATRPQRIDYKTLYNRGILATVAVACGGQPFLAGFLATVCIDMALQFLVEIALYRTAFPLR